MSGRAPTKRQLEARLRDAEGALAASYEATRTHGHSATTWACLKADAAEVRMLKGWLRAGNYSRMTAHSDHGGIA